MSAKVLVLLGVSAPDAEWIVELKSARLQLAVTHEWPAAIGSLRPGSNQVIVCDANSESCPVSEVLAVAHIACLPVVVVGHNLNALQWMALYKQGAFEVVSLPAPPGQILDALLSASKGGGGAKPVSGIDGSAGGPRIRSATGV